ncbi:hypothetical protein D3C81_1498450 [compost metagenome]
MENTSRPSTISAAITRLREMPWVACTALRALAWFRCSLYQLRSIKVTAKKNSPARPNQATCVCPNGITIAAANSGPSAEPVLPPTWKVD